MTNTQELLLDSDGLLTVSDICKLFKMPRSSVYDKARNNEFPFETLRFGNCIRFRCSEVRAFLVGNVSEVADAI